MSTAHAFTDPITNREVTLIVGNEMDDTGVRHPGCPALAHVSPDLDCFYCATCRWNGRISGAWFMDLWARR